MSYDKAYRHAYYLKHKKETMAYVEQYKKDHIEWFRKYHREYSRKNQPAARAKVREVVKKLKDVPCADCGKRFPWYVMDFDHVRGKKIREIGAMGNALSPIQILKEAKKCDVVCACCHRIRSYVTRRDKIPRRRPCR